MTPQRLASEIRDLGSRHPLKGCDRATDPHGIVKATW